MKKNTHQFLFLFILLVLPGVSSAATMSLSPSSTSINTGDIVTVRVVVNPTGTAINNAEGIVRFPPDMLKVLSVSKSSSIFPLWVEEPYFSNSAGTISFNGGVPNPGVSSPGTTLSISFNALRPGTATLSISDSAVRANDGFGTNVLTNSYGTQLTITSAVAVPTPTPTKPVESGTKTPSSGPIQITSSTHPDQSVWYANANPSFTWDLPKGATSVQLGIDQSSSAVPTVTYAKPIEEKTIDTVEDGISYFALRYRSGSTWSEVSRYQVRIDTVAPVITSHDFLYDQSQDAVLVRATGMDSGSGISTYEIAVDGAEPIVIQGNTFAEHSQSIKVRGAGIHSITLTALDAAGNRTRVDGSISVPPSLSTQILFRIGPIAFNLLSVLIIMSLLLILALMAALLEWRTILGYKSRRDPNIPLIRKDMHRGFLKMKENMAKDIRALDRARTKRDLSREELALYRRQMENMTALERHIAKQLTDAE
ncbi:MAG: hypothetical protein AB203_02245 [Parcubacteria bacterium C7867-008]|nr:MAG: hypothetical protein AB203_02245 [Parcubacteria bacterium C7867-008]